MLEGLENSHVFKSYVALLFGSLFAFALSGVLAVQCLIYFKIYPNDVKIRKTMVSGTWLLDTIHSTCIAAAMYDYFIKFFGNWERVDHIPWPVALTVAVTATQTLITHFFFIHRIFRSSNNNYWISVPIAILVVLRLTAACVSTSEMIMLHKYSSFTNKYPGWIFTTGLSLSAACDILITGWLCYFLAKMKERINAAGMVKVVDSLTLYTMENAALTCVVTVISLICWLTMPQNIIFLGLHFVIGKLYANSLLAALNTRKHWQQTRFNVPTKRTTAGGPMLTTYYTHPNTYQTQPTMSEKEGVSEVVTDTLTCPDPVYQGSCGDLDDGNVALEREVDPRVDNRHWQHHQDEPESDGASSVADDVEAVASQASSIASRRSNHSRPTSRRPAPRGSQKLYRSKGSRTTSPHNSQVSSRANTNPTSSSISSNVLFADPPMSLGWSYGVAGPAGHVVSLGRSGG